MALKETSDYKLPHMVDGALSSFMAHICFIPQHLRIHAPWKWGFGLVEKRSKKPIDFTQPNRVDFYLSRHLQYYSLDYRTKIMAQKGHNRSLWIFDGTNINLVRKRLKQKDPVGALESFVASANAEWRIPNRALYQSAGGDNRPFLATLYTMSIDGAYHVIHPLSLIWWSLGAYIIDSAHFGEIMLKWTGMWTVAFGLVGLPIALRKQYHLKKTKL